MSVLSETLLDDDAAIKDLGLKVDTQTVHQKDNTELAVHTDSGYYDGSMYTLPPPLQHGESSYYSMYPLHPPHGYPVTGQPSTLFTAHDPYYIHSHVHHPFVGMSYGFAPYNVHTNEYGHFEHPNEYVPEVATETISPVSPKKKRFSKKSKSEDTENDDDFEVQKSPTKRTKKSPIRQSKSQNNGGDGNGAYLGDGVGENDPSKRKMIEEQIICNMCDKQLGVFILRCKGETIDVESLKKLTCVDCSANSPSRLFLLNDSDDSRDASVSGNHKADKKRKRDQAVHITECEVCRTKIGSPIVANDTKSALKPEYVCTLCCNTYLFCSECGGGGKHRTGKWRPKELFDKNRRTCSLPHVRVGNAQIEFEHFGLNNRVITSSIFEGIKDIFFDSMLSLYAIPGIMRNSNGRTKSYQQVRDDAACQWNATVSKFFIQKTPPNIKRYVSLAWMDKKHRNKGKTNTKKVRISWLDRLGLTDVASTPWLDYSRENGDNEEDSNKNYIAYCIIDWDQQTNTIVFAQMTPRSVFLKTIEQYSEMVVLSIKQIADEALKMGLPVPETVMCWAPNNNSRIQGIPFRIGFIEMNRYRECNPQIPSYLLDRSVVYGYDPRNVFVYAQKTTMMLARFDSH